MDDYQLRVSSDDSLGFRYEFPQQSDFKYFIVSDEKTEFNLTGEP